MIDPIRICDVSKSFGDRQAINALSLNIKAGEITVLMGRSGSGKSTLLRMINGLMRPTSGSVKIQGRPLHELHAQELIALRRHSIAMVFQSFALFPHRTALENAAFGLEIGGMARRPRLERARHILDRVGLAKDLHRYPEQLSGGMRQRVGLARALALDPPILLMDEAFSALDPLIRTDMQDLLLGLQQEQPRTIVFVSHDIDEAVRVGDHIALLHNGQLLQVGTAPEFLLNPATETVRTFFSSIDRADVLHLGAIAEPANADSLDQLPRLPATTRLRDAMATIAHAGAIAVMDQQDQLQGVVTAQSLLHALQPQ